MRRIHTTLDTHAFERLQRLAQEQKKTISQIVPDILPRLKPVGFQHGTCEVGV